MTNVGHGSKCVHFPLALSMRCAMMAHKISKPPSFHLLLTCAAECADVKPQSCTYTKKYLKCAKDVRHGHGQPDCT